MGLFESLYDPLMKPLEWMGVQKWRQLVISKAHGRILEIGAGSGNNFVFYPKGAVVYALEPSPLLRQKATEKIPENTNFTLIDGIAEQLPFADESFDTVVSTLVLCSVNDLEQSIREMQRVLKSGGRLLLLEHVALKQPLGFALQTAINPAWKRMFGNCHLNRQTAITVQKYFPNVHEIPFLGELVVHLDATKTG